MVESLSAKEIVEYLNGGKSYFYVMGQTVITLAVKYSIFSYSVV